MRALDVLRSFVRRGGRSDTPACELCRSPIGVRHDHLVDLERRALTCACQACALLFAETHPGSRFRTVSRRVLSAPAPSSADLARLGIPVGLAFLVRASASGRWTAFYPSPAGATESEPALDPREAFGPELAEAVEPDVEALLYWTPTPGAALRVFVVPVDAAYALAGIVRRTWRGFDGGPEARRAIAAFFADLEARARPIARRARPADTTHDPSRARGAPSEPEASGAPRPDLRSEPSPRGGTP